MSSVPPSWGGRQSRDSLQPVMETESAESSVQPQASPTRTPPAVNPGIPGTPCASRLIEDLLSVAAARKARYGLGAKSAKRFRININLDFDTCYKSEREEKGTRTESIDKEYKVSKINEAIRNNTNNASARLSSRKRRRIEYARVQEVS
ncbi:hypothetical protein RR48_00364 [Papilio machaon]|uniref:Uncharacterized protein n=1 Tax=Papilio machaon TaxID=76193 RepID=A0A0N1IJQ0_PAPMA|nr:hypothetical protein RR48_00364 [Papilio machaon]